MGKNKKGGSGYNSLFKTTLSPCYDNTQKLGWYGGKKKTKTKRKTVRKLKGGDKISTCQSTTPSWHNRGQKPTSTIGLSAGINNWQFTRTLPKGKLYQASQLKYTPQCGIKYPDLIPKQGGSKKYKNGVKITIGRDGKKYFFKNGKRIKNLY